MRLRPTRAVRVSAVMCALTLTALSPFPLSPPAGADEPATPADSPAAGATTIDLLADGAAKALEIKSHFKPLMTKEEYLKDWGHIE